MTHIWTPDLIPNHSLAPISPLTYLGEREWNIQNELQNRAVTPAGRGQSLELQRIILRPCSCLAGLWTCLLAFSLIGNGNVCPKPVPPGLYSESRDLSGFTGFTDGKFVPRLDHTLSLTHTWFGFIWWNLALFKLMRFRWNFRLRADAEMGKNWRNVGITSMYFACGEDINLGEPKGRLLWFGLCSPIKGEVLTPGTSECDLIWKQGFHRCN